jgi:hypothetical protein
VAEPITVFAWAELVTDEVCREVAAWAGVPSLAPDRLRPLLAPIVSHTGGLPAFVGDPPADLDAVALRLVHEATRHVLGALGVTIAPPGVAREGDRLVATDRVDLNSASAALLESLPAIGPALAAAIVGERRLRGPFRSLDEAVDRVAGLGDAGARVLAGRVTAASPLTRQLGYHALGPAECLGALMAHAGVSDPADALIRTLETVAVVCAGSPHPASRERRPRGAVALATSAHVAEAVHLLRGGSYYGAVQDAINGASASVEVAMFHIALPGETHPTRAILDALAGAHERGVTVRVLVDRDRARDPYKSEVINRPALDYLRARGVACRSDETSRLLHSKFMVVDGAEVVIGSHNWTAGSYFQFDDTSVRIVSPPLAVELQSRFESLWALGSDDTV